MRIDTFSNTTFGLRKLTSFRDLAKQRNIRMTSLESNGLKDYIEYVKEVAINMKRNEAKAIESAKKIFIK